MKNMAGGFGCPLFFAQKKGAVKKSATKPVDFLDMEAHGL